MVDAQKAADFREASERRHDTSSQAYQRCLREAAPHTSDICLLEDKVQDRGMYLFAISYGSDAMDRRSEMVDSVDDLRSSSSIRGFRNSIRSGTEFCL